MSRPGFFEGVVVAAAASLAGGAVHAALTTVFPPPSVFRLVVATLALAYIVYLVRRSDERVGRVVAVASWALATAATWLLGASSLGFLCVQLGLVWLVRSLYFHSSLLAALADLGLVALGFAAAVWAASRSNSAALCLWAFFLVQALYVAIPQRTSGRDAPDGADADRFAHAHRAAEAAVRRMYTIR
jgi:hypothetical protein